MCGIRYTYRICVLQVSTYVRGFEEIYRYFLNEYLTNNDASNKLTFFVNDRIAYSRYRL